jgi:mono/diheme cytochrome c family protein
VAAPLLIALLLAAGRSGAPGAYDGETVERDPGMVLWLKRCAYCHGDEGTAHNTLGLRYRARNFTDVAWQARTSDARIRSSILLGVPGTKMRGFRASYSDAEVDLLVAVIRGFRGTKIGDGTTR